VEARRDESNRNLFSLRAWSFNFSPIARCDAATGSPCSQLDHASSPLLLELDTSAEVWRCERTSAGKRSTRRIATPCNRHSKRGPDRHRHPSGQGQARRCVNGGHRNIHARCTGRRRLVVASGEVPLSRTPRAGVLPWASASGCGPWRAPDAENAASWRAALGPGRRRLVVARGEVPPPRTPRAGV
jgi:hypothetical protein